MENFGIKGTVQWDEHPMNPRHYDNIGTMVCLHSRYRLGDTQNEPITLDNHIILPLYLYDHSGLSISTSPFSCSWDSRQVGIIYAEKGSESMTDDEIKAYLEAEVANYDTYLQGEVYEFIIEDKYGDIIESCGGFYSEEQCQEEMEAVLAAIIEEERKKLSSIESEFPIEDWKYQVANGDTILGLKDWREHMYESKNS